MVVVAATLVDLLNRGYVDWSVKRSMLPVLAMLFLFFSKEHMEDERVRELKLKALTAAFAFGFIVVFAVRLSLKDNRIPGSMSAYDFMLVTLIMAFGLFHGWWWEDGQATPEDRKRDAPPGP